MVALVITGIVLGALFSVSKTSTDTFNQQQRAAEMQLRLRFAMEQLRADVQRAGYMTTPNSQTDPRVCPRPMTVMAGIEVANDTPPLPLTSDNTFITAKVLRLMGNFTSADEYAVAGVAPNGTTIYLQNRTPQWARVTSSSEMSRIFPTGTSLRVTNANGVSQFVTISGTSYQASTSSTLPSIEVSSSPALLVVGATTGGSTIGCGISGLGVGASVSAVTMVEYRIANLAGTQAELYPANPALSAAKTDLVRTEYLYPSRTVISGTQRIVGEYTVDLDFGVSFDVGFPTTAPDSLVRINSYRIGDTRVTSLLGPIGTSGLPQQARTLSVRLSMRDREQDPAFGWIARTAATDPLTRFRVLNDRVGAARVRTLTTDIVLPNLSARNLR